MTGDTWVVVTFVTMIDMNPRQAELSRQIDVTILGKRIRHARLAAGLRQAGLAEAAGVTTAYISRIEAGERRPEASKLEAMAKAMGVSIDALVAPGEPAALDADTRFKLDQAQLAYAAGSVDEAESAAQAVLDGLGEGLAADNARWQAELIIALCHEARGDRSQAIVELERIATHPRPDAVWIKTWIALSRCTREAGDTARAIEVGEGAIETLEKFGLSQTTEAIQLRLTVAAAYSAQGEVDRAAKMCRYAADDSVVIGSPVAQASAYWNSSILEARRGHADSAVRLASKAVALFEVAEDRRNLGRLRTDLALMQLAMDPPQADEAAANLERARREFNWSAASPTDYGRNRLVMAQTMAVRGATHDALQAIEDVLEMDAQVAPMLRAEAMVARGQRLAELGRAPEALESCREAVLLASSVGADRDAAQFWFDLAEMLDTLGGHEDARDAYRRSAASAGMTSRRPHHVRQQQ